MHIIIFTSFISNVNRRRSFSCDFFFVGSLLGWFFLHTTQTNSTNKKHCWGIIIVFVIKRIFYMIYIILHSKSNRTRNSTSLLFLSLSWWDVYSVSILCIILLEIMNQASSSSLSSYLACFMKQSQEMKLMMLSKTDIFRANGKIKRNFDQK